ncbi:MAG TPA: APC family permease [Gaiellaceae bacterium]|jgi:amino acid transporter|nr:APC family permease [Gaiellaceae bacterium]
MATNPSSDRLRRDSIGLPQVLFQSVTHMAPAVSLTFVFFTAIQFTGPVLPLALLIALLAMLCVAVAIGQLAKEIPSAGGLYTYVSNGLGSGVGFVVGWCFMLIEPLVAPLLFLLFGFLLQDVFENDIGWGTGWVVWVVVAAVAMFLLAYRDVRVSLGAGMALGAFEIGVFLLLALWIIGSAGSDNTLEVFDPTNAAAGTWEGTFKGVVFAITALVGFEAAAPLGEEARRPRWTVPRALFLACLAIGIFYIVTSYAWIIGTGFEQFTETTLGSANPIRELSEAFWGWGWWIIFAALVNGVLANGNAALNTASRIAYAMSRAGALPKPLSRTHPTYGTPHVAIVLQAAFGLVLALLLGWKWDPLTGLSILGTTIGITIIVCYITVSVAAIAYFWRRGREHFNVLLHGLLPAIGAIAFLFPLWYQYNPLPPYPLRWANWIAPAWIAIGIGVVALLSARRPQALERAREVYVEEDRLHPGEMEPGLVHPTP